MSDWTFFDFISPAGNNKIIQWYEDLSDTEQEAFEALVGILSRTKIWRMPEYCPLSGSKYAGLGEIRFKSEQKQYRVIGILNHPSKNQYTFLVGCMHKQRVYKPTDALDTAVKRKRMLFNRTASLVKHEI